MKIIRHQTASGPAYAALKPDDSAWEVSGSLFTGFAVTERSVQLGRLLAPIEPPNIFGIGLNYRQHANSIGRDLPTYPMLFIKSTNTLQNPREDIRLPGEFAGRAVDYEGELAVVIGRACRNVSREEAMDYVLGYTCANDVTARDWQFQLGGGQFCQGKSFDTFCPLGPVLVTADEIPDPGSLRLSTRVNGVVRQNGSTGDMIFDVPSLISFLSKGKTLLPGTVILTGTPHGVGHTWTPPVYLQPGDRVEIEIENIGTLVNNVAAG